MTEIHKQADRLLDSMEHQSELIAALRNEVSTWKNGFDAANEALQYSAKRIAELEADYQKQYNMVTGSVQYAKSLERRITELEAQLAAALATIDRATTDGELYAEGCKP